MIFCESISSRACLSTSGKTFEVDGIEYTFAQRLWISTTNKWNSAAEFTIKKQTPQVTRLNLIDLEADDVDWEKLEHGLYGKASRPKPFAIMEHQQKAINRVHEYFKTRDRGKLIMACGTGKTFTSLKIAENETQSNGFVLFLVPSIALLGQTLRAWSAQASGPNHAVCICPDGQVSQQKMKNDEGAEIVIDLALPASTNTDYIINFRPFGARDVKACRVFHIPIHRGYIPYAKRIAEAYASGIWRIRFDNLRRSSPHNRRVSERNRRKCIYQSA